MENWKIVRRRGETKSDLKKIPAEKKGGLSQAKNPCHLNEEEPGAGWKEKGSTRKIHEEKQTEARQTFLRVAQRKKKNWSEGCVGKRSAGEKIPDSYGYFDKFAVRREEEVRIAQHRELPVDEKARSRVLRVPSLTC